MRSFLRLIYMIRNIEQLLGKILRALEQLQPVVMEEEVWMDSCEVRDFFKIHRSTLYRWRTEALVIPKKVGKKNMYRKSDIVRLLEGGE